MHKNKNINCEKNGGKYSQTCVEYLLEKPEQQCSRRENKVLNSTTIDA